MTSLHSIPAPASARGAARAALEAEGVSKRYTLAGGSEVDALSNIDLRVDAGQIVVIVGGSGSGKSTLLRLIAGLERADGGRISIAGRRVDGPSRDCAMVFQEHRLFPWLNVVDNIAFGLADVSARERRRAVDEHVALVGLAGFERAYPHQLSGGMAQRVAIARALAPRPRLLLLDEPFGALDALTKMRMQDELLRIWEAERPTLVLVTHDVEEAVYLGSRIVVLAGRPGRLRCDLELGLERPRDRTSPDFAALRRAVLAELLDDTPRSVHGARAPHPARGASAPTSPRTFPS